MCECGSAEIGQVSQREQRMDVEICSWGKRVVRSENLETFKKHLKEERTRQWLENKSPT